MHFMLSLSLGRLIKYYIRAMSEDLVSDWLNGWTRGGNNKEPALLESLCRMLASPILSYEGIGWKTSKFLIIKAQIQRSSSKLFFQPPIKSFLIQISPLYCWKSSHLSFSPSSESIFLCKGQEASEASTQVFFSLWNSPLNLSLSFPNALTSVGVVVGLQQRMNLASQEIWLQSY